MVHVLDGREVRRLHRALLPQRRGVAQRAQIRLEGIVRQAHIQREKIACFQQEARFSTLEDPLFEPTVYF